MLIQAHGYSAKSVDILRNRDCSMYVNEEYATSARILRGEDAVKWYNRNFGTNYEEKKCLYDLSKFTTSEPISVLENGSYYWFASSASSSALYYVNPRDRLVNSNYYSGSYGFRDSPPSVSRL